MKSEEELVKIFGEVQRYLDKKFTGVRIYECIGFLEDFKAILIDEIKQEQRSKEN